jgi:hypothetical protein
MLSEFLLDSALRPRQNLPHASWIELRNKNVVTVMLSPIFEAMNSANDSPLALERVLFPLPEKSFRAIGAEKCAQRFVAVRYFPLFPWVPQRLERGVRNIE